MRSALLAALLASSCAPSSTVPDAGSQEGIDADRDSAFADPAIAAAPISPTAPDAGADLVARFECRRCHDDEGTPPLARGVRDDKHCFHCHQRILAGEVLARDAPTNERWLERVAPLRDVPSLVGSRARLRRAWIARFLLAPHDLRPRLEPTMPRLALTPAQAEAIAAYYGGEDGAAQDDALRGADAEKGRALLDAKGCGSCHAFTGAPAARSAAQGSKPAAPSPPLSNTGLTPAVTLALDLRFTRDRFLPGALAAWIERPKAMKPDTSMPETGLTGAEARDIAAYLLTAPLDPPAARPVPPRLPVLTRPVAFAEVRARVFRKTCWHCHSDPDYAIGDGGPGNTGGFGFTPRGLNLAEYEGIASGALDDAGERRSVLAPGADGVSRMLSALLARQREEADPEAPAGSIRGMPLGLPALPPEEVQLVESWIAQGRPR